MSSPVDPTDPTLAADAQPSMAPEELSRTVVADRYEIVALLGAGGMGRVYRAQDRELGEMVALKVLHRDWVRSEDMVERFRQEVRLARRVTHRNVARTFDIGEHEGEKFLTMELVAGEPLSRVLARRGALSAKDAVPIAQQICAGMAAAHAVGVVHRDLKPDNVLVGDDGRVVITDFGIARTELPDQASRTEGRAIGTPTYMAPEQIEAQGPIDGRADIYAFGAMLFEMLTGTPAWQGESAYMVAAARLLHPPPSIRDRCADVDPVLGQLVERCMARERDRRFPTAMALGEALAALDASGSSVPSVVPPEVERSTAMPLDERTVAILPFKNLGPPEDVYVAEGLTEDLLDALSMTRGLRVKGAGIARSDLGPVEAGRKLGVEVVIDGLVRRAGANLRVNARVLSVADGFQVWGGRFDRSFDAAFALNDEVASAVAVALSSEEHRRRRSTKTSGEAIELYFRARHELATFWLNRLPAAEDLFARALELAPDDPTILAGFVAQYGRNVLFSRNSSAEEVKALARRALTAGPELSEPWVALASVRFYLLDDAPCAVRAARRAVLQGPSVADAHDIAGRLLLEAAERDEATSHLERALWLDPKLSWTRVDLVRDAALAADWERVRALAESAQGEWGQRSLTAMRFELWRGAPSHAYKPLPADADQRLLVMQATYAALAKERRWRPEFEQLFGAHAGTLSPRGLRLFAQLLVEVATACGKLDIALEHLRRAVDAGLMDLLWLDRLALLDPLRALPGFGPLRGVVAARARAVRDAWNEPLESVETALSSLA